MFRRLHDWLGRNSTQHAMLMVVESCIRHMPEEWAKSQNVWTNTRRRLVLCLGKSAFGLKLYDGHCERSGRRIRFPLGWKCRLWLTAKGHGAPNASEIINRFRDGQIIHITIGGPDAPSGF